MSSRHTRQVSKPVNRKTLLRNKLVFTSYYKVFAHWYVIIHNSIMFLLNIIQFIQLSNTHITVSIICWLPSLGIFGANTAQLSLSICPRHRDAFGIRWWCFKNFCTCPPLWAEHKTTNVKGDRGITCQQSKQLFYDMQILVPLASRKLKIILLISFCTFLLLVIWYLAICFSHL